MFLNYVIRVLQDGFKGLCIKNVMQYCKTIEIWEVFNDHIQYKNY